MADYKDYIVRYDIQTNVANASIGLREMLALVEQLQKQATPAATAIKDIASVGTHLREQLGKPFELTINTSVFQSQVRSMVAQVEEAAAKMHAAIYNALKGNTQGTKVAQTGIGKALDGKRTIAEIKRANADIEREIDKLMGAKTKKDRQGRSIRDTRSGSIYMARNNAAQKATLIAQRDNLLAELKANKAILREMEATEKQIAAQSKSTAQTQTAIASKPTSNVTPAQIRAWKQYFGNKNVKNLTLNIKAVDEATSVINTIRESLNGLKALGKFEILPTLNQGTYAKVEQQLKQLASLSQKVANPLAGAKEEKGKSIISKADKAKITAAQTKLKALNQAAAPIQQRLNKNLAIPEENRTRGIKGQITKDTKALGTIVTQAKEQEQIIAGIKGQSISSASKPVSTAKPVTVSVTGKINKIEPPANPPIVSIIGKLKKIEAPAKIPTVPVIGKLKELQTKATEGIPVNVKILSEQVAVSLKSVEPTLPPLNVKVQLLAEGVQQQVQALAGQIKPVTASKNAGTRTIASKSVNPATAMPLAQVINERMGLGAGHFQFRQQRMAEAASAFRKGLTPYERLSKAKQIRITKPEVWKRYSNVTTRFRNQLVNLGLNESQIRVVRENVRFFEQATRNTGVNPTSTTPASTMLPYMNNVMAQMQAANAPIPVQMKSYADRLQKQVAKENRIATRSNGGGGGSKATSVPYRSPYDQVRKWAFPLTGSTSFGVRTPMAVDMAKGMGVMFAIGGAMSAIGGSFSQAMEYQNMMKTTQAILQNGTDSYTQSGFGNMERTVRDVGVKTKFSAPEVASASKFLAMAGFDIESINAAIRPIADLALIGDMDLGEVADKMTNIMTTFGASSDALKRNPNLMREMANIMTTTATRSNTDLMMLAESAKYGGGVAKMYGYKDPNLFADTMAIFGVMGNAGVQGSSAGTALRMMYQNIFKPNKNQRKMLDMMKSTYGISTTDSNGGYRSMSDILVEMAQRIPENKMAEIVGNLFRITAQPGATASIMAAAGGDANAAQEIIAGNDELVKRMSSKTGLSSLASLMLANRASVSGNISGAISEEKQNTLSGLWAQVTSMFTEAIVKAFEERQGGFAEMLKKVRDYFAKPETVTMIKNLLDMIIEIGKVMAWFVKIWANLYNAAPGLVKSWVVIQMMFTQIGSLIAPVVQLMGILNRFGGMLLRLAGVSTLASTHATRGVVGGVAAAGVMGSVTSGVPYIMPNAYGKRPLKLRGNIGQRARKEMIDNVLLASQYAAMGIGDMHNNLGNFNGGTQLHYSQVAHRAKRMYGWRSVRRAYKAGRHATLNIAWIAAIFSNIQSIFMGLMRGLAKAFGLLANPITIAIGAIGTLGYGLYKLVQHANGATEAQKNAYNKGKALVDITAQNIAKSAEWYNSQNQGRIVRGTVIHSEQSEAAKAYSERQKKFKNDYLFLFNNFDKDASDQLNQSTAKEWRRMIKSNSSYKLSLGDKYEELAGTGLTSWTNSNYMWNQGPESLVGAIHDAWVEDEDHAVDLQKRMIQGALMTAGGNSAIAQEYVNKINTLKGQLLSKDITKSYYNAEIAKIANEVNALVPKKLVNGANLSLGEFQNISNPEAYVQYWNGLANMINATIRGDVGTQTGAMQSWYDLTNRDNKGNLANGLEVWSAEWYRKIAGIMNDIRITDHFIGDKTQKDIELILSMCPETGKIDTQSIVDQVRSQIGSFNLTLQQYADMMNQVYDILKQSGILTDDSGRYKFIRNQLVGTQFTGTTVSKYWDDYIGSNANSEWVKAGIQKNEYIKWAMGAKGAMSDAEMSKKLGRYTSRQQEFRNMNNNIAHKVANSTKFKAVIPATVTTSPTGTTPAPSAPAPTTYDQDGYASHYDRGVERPTQIVFNINEMAHFDRTTVASSAEERDLVAAMEAKIAPIVYQIFAQAANQANNMQLA